MKEAITQIEGYERRLKEKDNEIMDLKATITLLQEETEQQKQHSIRNELEIMGIDESSNENLFHLTSLVLAKTGITVKEEDIDEIYRTGSKRSGKVNPSTRLIVVRLVRHR